MKLKALIKQNSLFISMAIGALIYEIFAHISCLEPVSCTMGPILTDWLPVGLFLLLYATFCKIKISEMKPRAWHFVIQLVRTSLAAFMVLLISLFGDNAEIKLILEGMFICFICPTAAAVVVVTEKLGGSIGSLTMFTITANIVTMFIIPFFFPMVERSADITFLSSMLMILRNVTMVLVVPLFLALLSRRIIPNVVNRLNKHKDIGFYIWCVNLSIITGITLHNIEKSSITGWVLWLLLILPLGVCILQFALGKLVGRRWNDSISAGQALGQKNTVVGIWLTLTFLNPLAAISPGAYVLWQNLVNGWQIWYKEKHGHVKW
jgi:BASS family bile acid:Na+ symporter